MNFDRIKKKLLKSFLLFSLSLSLLSGPVAGNEVSKLLECLSGAKDAKIQELDAEGEATGEPEAIHKKK